MIMSCGNTLSTTLKLSVILFLLPGDVLGLEAFKSIKLVESAKNYLVLKDVNIRAKPKNRSNRVGRFRKFERIEAVGRANKTNWIAVRKNNKNLGFVYATALTPVINGELRNIVYGRIERTQGVNDSPPCNYTIKFLGKDKVEGNMQIMSDYSLNLMCDHANIDATMFLTELPYLANRKPIFQINIDIYNIPKISEDIFSTTALYHATSNKLTFDGVNEEAFRSSAEITEVKVENIVAALKGSVLMAYKSWGKSFWNQLIQEQTN